MSINPKSELHRWTNPLLAISGLVYAIALASARSATAGNTLGSRLAIGQAAALLAVVVLVFDVQRRLTRRESIRQVWIGTIRPAVAAFVVSVTIALFLFPVGNGANSGTRVSVGALKDLSVAGGDPGAPSWRKVVAEWVSLGWLRSDTFPADRLTSGWMISTLLVSTALLWTLHHKFKISERLWILIGAGLLSAGLVGRLLLWRYTGRFPSALQISPIGSLDLIGATVLLANTRVRLNARLAGTVSGLFGAGFLAVNRSALSGVGSPLGRWLALGAVLSFIVAVDQIPLRISESWGRRFQQLGLWPFFTAALATQLWASRAGGDAHPLRIGPIVIVTATGVAVIGWLLGRGVTTALFKYDCASRFQRTVAVITGGAFVWRLLTLVSINRANPSGGDPFFYHQQANMLADRVGYSEPFRWTQSMLAVPSAIHPPLMSTWLGLGSFFGARSYLAHKTLAAALAVCVVFIGASIAKQVAGERAGICAAIAIAIYPNFWVIDGVLWPEGLYTTLVAVTVWVTLRWWKRPNLASAALLGLAISGAALTRGEGIFLFPLLAFAVVMARRGLSPSFKLKSLAVCGAVGVLTLAPWTIRNYRAFDQPVLLSTNSDEVIYYANCPDTYYGAVVGSWSFNCQERDRLINGEPPGNEAQKARYWRARGVAYAKTHKSRIPTVIVARIVREFDLYQPRQNVRLLRIEGRPQTVSQLGQIAWWICAPLGLFGLLLLRSRRVLILPFLGLSAMVLCTTVYAYGATRFRTPLELVFLISASVVVAALLDRWRPETS